MYEFQLVPHPQIFPSACVCGSQHGPILDTHIERPGYGRVYLCKLCAFRVALRYGFAKGDEMNKLMDARAGLEQAEKEIETRNQRLRSMETELHQRDGRIRELEAELQRERGESELLRHRVEQVQEFVGKSV